MKGLILSGGKGTRMRPLTFTQAKQLIPVANKPVLFYGIEALRDAGIREIGIVVGDTRDEIREACGDGARWGVRITYIEQEAPLGLAHAVLISEGFLRGGAQGAGAAGNAQAGPGGEGRGAGAGATDPDGDGTFVMYLGDNILKSGITSLVEEFRSKRPNSLILLTRVPNPRMFGVAELENGRVARLVEKPQEPKSDLALVGVYMFDAHIFEAAKAIAPSGRGELEITDAIQYLVERGFEVQPHLVEGWWKDTGKIEDILDANRLILEGMAGRIDGDVDGASQTSGSVVVERGAVVRRSIIRGPAVVGEGATIEDAYVGPFTAIGPRCRVARTEIEHSIVLEGAEILDVGARIDESLIGRDVRIYKCPPRPSAYRFMVGDKSEIGIK